MYEPPVDLPNDTLAACLRTQYGLAVTEVSFLPIGLDSRAWVYRVRTAGGTLYFLKVRESLTNTPSLLVPRYLHDRGVTQVIAPLPTISQTLWTAVEGYALMLYPFVAGNTGMAQGMAPEQWIAYGAILRQIHATALSPDLAQLMRHETFVPVGAGMVRDHEAHLDAGAFAGDAAQELAAFWQERRELIHMLAARAEDLGRRLARTAPPLVLCHADIHTNNVMIDTGGQAWIVDWDETVLAPKERDLMFVIGGGIDRTVVGPAEEELFLQGYGPSALDPLALAYYRYAWAASDIGEYGSEVFLRPDLSAGSKRAALESFRGLFLPGNIVTLALASDDRTA